MRIGQERLPKKWRFPIFILAGALSITLLVENTSDNDSHSGPVAHATTSVPPISTTHNSLATIAPPQSSAKYEGINKDDEIYATTTTQSPKLTKLIGEYCAAAVRAAGNFRVGADEEGDMIRANSLRSDLYERYREITNHDPDAPDLDILASDEQACPENFFEEMDRRAHDG